jgi:type IV secretory pathway VirJ component
VIGRILLPALLGLAAAAASAQEVRSLEHGRFGTFALLVPHVAPVGMALLLVDAPHGATLAEPLASALAARGLVVAQVDTAHYLAELRGKEKGCNFLAADLEDLAHRVGREAGLGEYLSPVLVGRWEGAALVQIALLQAPGGTFAGGLGVEAAGSVTLGKAALCAGPRGAIHRDATAQGRYTLDPQMARDVGYVQQATPSAGGTDEAGAAVLHVLNVALPVAAALAADVNDLPLVVLPVQTPATKLVLMISGDGGWAGIDKEVGAQLADRGLPVIGVSSLKYFWKRRTPEETAADMTRVLRHYLNSWKASQIVLVGYSFGADVMPFIVNRLPADLRARIASVNLLALGERADFEVHVSGWMGGVGSDALLIAPELARTADLRRLCLYGAGDHDSTASCAGFVGPRSVSRQVGQGHHFGYLYSEIADQIADFAGR